MRIISKHHDYYDCAAKQLRDPSVTFVRKTKEIFCNPFEKSMGHLSQMYSRWTIKTNEQYHITPEVLFFCGSVYPYMSFTDFTTNTGYIGWETSHPTLIGFTKESVMEKTPEFLHEHIKVWFDEGKIYPNFGTENGKNGKRKSAAKYKSFLRGLSPYFTLNKDILTQYAIKNGIAYFSLEYAFYEGTKYTDKYTVYDGIKVVHYPILKDKCFFTIMPITEAFQRIQMYLTNELARERDMKIKPVPDKIKAESHGFDKFSFRKDPVNTR